MRLNPITIKRNVVLCKVPSLASFKSELIFKKITKENYTLVNSLGFSRNFKYGYKGYLVYNKNSEMVGYCWYTENTSPPTHIPKIPKTGIWLFNMLVFENHRGHGFQRDMLRYLEYKLKKKEIIFVDIKQDNIPSLKNVLREGYEQKGIYYVLFIGLRRSKYLNFKIGYWAKNKKVNLDSIK